MKLYGIDLLLSLACARVIKVQGLEFEAAENNLSEVPSHSYDFWNDSSSDPSRVTPHTDHPPFESIAEKRQLNAASNDVYWGHGQQFCGARGTEIKCIGTVFNGGHYPAREPTDICEIFTSDSRRWCPRYINGNPNPVPNSPYTAGMALPIQKVATTGHSFMILDAEGKVYQFPLNTGGAYVAHVTTMVTPEQRFEDISGGSHSFCVKPIGSDIICWGRDLNIITSDMLSNTKFYQNDYSSYCLVYKDDDIQCKYGFPTKTEIKTALGKSASSIVELAGNDDTSFVVFSDRTVACKTGWPQYGKFCGLGSGANGSGVYLTNFEYVMVPALQNVRAGTLSSNAYERSFVAMIGDKPYGWGFSGYQMRKFGEQSSMWNYDFIDLSPLLPAGETAVEVWQSQTCIYMLSASGNLYFAGENKLYGSGDPSMDTTAFVAGVGQAKLIDMDWTVPTQSPSSVPSESPSGIPTVSMSPSKSASDQPSNEPSSSLEPSNPPSNYPTVSSKPSSRPVIVNPCWNQNCNNAGKCEAISSKEFKCRCEATFINSADGRTCVCPPGFIRKSDNRCYDPTTSVPIPITSSPTASPNVSNTSAPTASPNVSNTSGPTSSPSQTVADEEDEGCNDDENARFHLIHDNDKHVKCSWLTANKNRTGKRISNYCDLPRVKTVCKSTCSFCTCVDDEAFTFELIKIEDPKRKTQHCDWLTRNKVNHELRIARYCTEDFEDGAVMNACTKSCRLCE